MSRWDLEIEQGYLLEAINVNELDTGGVRPFIVSVNGVDLYYGVGVEYVVNEKLFVSAGYSVLSMRYRPPGLWTGNDDSDLSDASVSIGYKF